MKYSAARHAAGFLYLAASPLRPDAAWAETGHLGAGGSPQIAVARIIAALVICMIVAILAALLIKQRRGTIDLKAWLGRVDFGTRAIKVVETRHLSAHADLCLVEVRGKEYLLLLQAGQAQILNQRDVTLPSNGIADLCG